MFSTGQSTMNGSYQYVPKNMINNIAATCFLLIISTTSSIYNTCFNTLSKQLGRYFDLSK